MCYGGHTYPQARPSRQIMIKSEHFFCLTTDLPYLCIVYRKHCLSRMKTYPLLDSQLGVLLSCSYTPSSTAWNLPSVIFFDKTISADRLLDAVRRVCAARMELHVQFLRADDGTFLQYADAGIEIPVAYSKMTDSEAEMYMKDGFVRPFSLFSNMPLCRFEVVETDTRVLLLSDFHHSIADGYTIAGRLIGTDLPAAYMGQTLDPPAMTLFDWAQREKEEKDSAAYIRAKDYYRTLFSDAEVTRLSQKTTADGGKGLSCSFSLAMGAVDEWCAAHKVSAYHFLMSAFCLTLSKLSHQTKVVFCTLNHGRYDKRLSEAYGMFVNTVPFVADIDPSMTVSMLMAQVRKCLMDNHRHRFYPFTHFCSDMGAVPKITFGFQSNEILEQTVITGRKFVGRQLQKPDSQSDLSVMVYSSGDEYEVRVEASDALYMLADLKRFGDAMRHCVAELMSENHKTVGETDLIDQSQKVQLMQLSAGERTDFDRSLTVVDMFLLQTKKNPDATAVSDGNCALTYRELECLSRVLANRLKSDGVGAGSFVGVDTTPCCEFLVAALAIMRAGGAYVPVDPHLPPKRREHIICDAEIKILVDAGYVRTCVSSDEPALPIDHSTPQGIAYMIYTSGSTGKPKGVAVRHIGLANLVRFCVRRWPLNCNSRIACHSTLAFDASVEDLFPVLTVGGCVVMVPEAVRTDLDALALFMQRQHVTGGCLTTRLGVALADAHPLDVDYLCLGGERLMSNPTVKGRVYNTYGPTEFTVDATYCELEKGRAYGSIPIGRPLDNCHAFVVDPYGCLLPQGGVGELWLAGPQVAAGYWHDDQLTEKNFTACSFFEGTVYHTGDLVRWNNDGLLEYVGRVDNMMKIDGMRISLEEIEQRMLSIPQVSSAAVVAEEVNGKPQIHAFFTSEINVTEEDVIKTLREYLPPQMIPQKLARLEKMPLLPSGKVDRRQLHVGLGFVEYAAPADALEEMICVLMAEVLDLDHVGATDDFFAMGGSSLSAMQLVAEGRKRGVSIALADIFSKPTPRLLSRCVKRTGDSHEYDVGDYDYGTIHQLLKQGGAACSGAYPNGGTMLLAGATGFLGIHVLARFLASNSWKVVCLVRGRDAKEAWQRLQDRWHIYFQHQSLDTDKVSVVCGDLTLPQTLQECKFPPFNILVNCAADVRYFAKDNNIVEVNANGAAYLARMCKEKSARLIHISTLSIAGVGPAGGLMSVSPHELYIHQRFVDQYSYSKFLAEREILQRVASGGLNANVVRVGHLAPRSTDGRSQINISENMLYSLLRVMADVGGCPQSAEGMEVEWIPVDVVAEWLLDQTTKGFSHPVIHVEGMKRWTLKHLADDYAGISLPVLSDDTFRKRLHEHPHNDITSLVWLRC